MRTNHNASGKPSLEGCVGLRYPLRWVLQATYPWVCGILTFLSYYGLQLPQGSYPSAINSSLLPLNSSLFFAFIFLTLLQSGLWNFPVFVLITSASRSLPDFEWGFRPACEVKTGTFDPRTTFCRPVIPRSSLITNSACSALSVSAFSTTAFPS